MHGHSSPGRRGTSVSVIGGGIMGISAALRLAGAGCSVTLFERRAELGGLSGSFNCGNVAWDRFYHVILSTDRVMIDFLRELELDHDLHFAESHTGFFGDGKLVPFSSIKDFILFPFLSLAQKFRLGLGVLRAVSIQEPTKLDRVYVREWLTRMFGRRVYERIWDPLLRSKFGAARERTSAAFMWATIRRLYGARDTPEKKERMGYVHGGYRRIIECATAKLIDAGVRISRADDVDAVRADGVGVIVSATSGVHLFDRAVLTVPCPEALAMLGEGAVGEGAVGEGAVGEGAVGMSAGVSAGGEPAVGSTGSVKAGDERAGGEYWDRMRDVEYLRVVCVVLVLKRSLSPYYVTNLLENELPFTGIIEVSNVVSTSELAGRHLVYLPRYCTSDSDEYSLPDEEVAAHFLSGLRKVHPTLRDNEIECLRVFREPYVQPLQQLNYLDQALEHRTPIPGVYVSNTSMIYNSTLNNNAVIELGRSVADAVLRDAGHDRVDEADVDEVPVSTPGRHSPGGRQ